MEISYGIAWLRHCRATRKAPLLQAWLDDLIAYHQPRIIEVDAEDALIAATAELKAITVLTGNARHFAPMRVRYADPRAGLPPDVI